MTSRPGKATWAGLSNSISKVPTGLFTLSVESPINLLSELSERDRDRFLDIDEAIRRYSRGVHGGLINQPAKADTEADLQFSNNSQQPRDIDFSFDSTL